MSKILVCGGTGQLGRVVVAELLARGQAVRVLTRDAARAAALGAVEVHVGDARDRDSLRGAFDGVDTVFSSVGASVSPKLGAGWRGYRGVDVPANRNVLAGAVQAGVSRFVYVSAHVIPETVGYAYFAAHERVAREVLAAPLDGRVLRPTAFFSALVPFLDMARSGKVMVIGDGRPVSNPIHDADLADAAVAMLLAARGEGLREQSLGGPDVLSREEIAGLACDAVKRPRSYRKLPAWFMRLERRSETAHEDRRHTSSRDLPTSGGADVGDEWDASVELREEEVALLELCKKQKLWAFFRTYRHEILDGEVRAALGAMYKSSAKGGRPPVAPERLALAMLLQVGFGNADHEVPILSAVDQRWQMVLDVMGAKEPAFSQGTLFSFRERARAHGLMTLMLNKTVELARTSKGFDHKRLRALIDSSPLVGAGRVEDTFNLLGRALAQLIDAVAEEAAVAVDTLAAELELSVVGATSIKAALDVDWRKPAARTNALQALVDQFDRLRGWIKAHLDQTKVEQPPLSEQVALVERIIAQDTEPDPDGPPAGKMRRLREGVGPERIISLSDPDMRHGRKSTTKAFNGYKRHVAIDADVQGLICAVKVVPANRPEHEAVAPLMEAVAANGFAVTALHADRGYLPAQELVAMHDAGVTVISKPPTPAKTDHFGKDAFAINFDDKTVTCPGNVTVPLVPKVRFPEAACGACPLRDRCTTSTRRCLSIHPQEAWYREMANELATQGGRALRRERVPVEHALAHASAIQGNRARFRGLEKNQFDLERVAVLSNCFVLARLWQQAA